ncbi:pyridoxal-dependent decarboxylase, exosortase A system-associated [Chitinivorax sp. B]|uniref:pyridoxal-dependent decarboxylase, exosortase A system-associated n=1 Tax=Chitinivorax sp. B TaxID=2502235 RepID=UPI0010F6C778|nr:pyridoxal-dependent decarboxylase, exosortase A system-associated [Chitinivorax sp. B]
MTASKPVHAPVLFPVVDQCLMIGGLPLPRLTARVGQTPFYAYDRQLLTQRVKDLRAALPSGIELHYAMKANPMPAVVQHMANLVDGLDVASGRELRIALDTGMNPGNISFAGPGKGEGELSQAIAAGIVINLESETELEHVANLGSVLGIKPKVAVRVNPDFELKSSGMRMGGGPKQFGIDAERVPTTLKRIGELELDFEGFHIFSGSQNLKSESIVEAHNLTFELALRLAEHAPSPLKALNIGGGFGIPYFPGEGRLDLSPIADNLAVKLPDIKAQLSGTAIVIELGRHLVGEAGIYVCKIIDKKISRGHTYLVTDGGLHHHLSASGNFGQVIRKNYPVTIGNRVGSPHTELVSIVGPLCTPLDLLGDKMELPAAEIGDLVVVFQSGAYGYTASPTRFLSHAEPVEVLI